MTFWSTFSLYLAAARIFSSTLLTVHRRSTRTSFCCPIRWALSWACRSCEKKSKNRTVKHLPILKGKERVQKISDTPVILHLVRVPVAVEDDDGVGRLQVQAQTSSPGAQQEHKVLAGWVIECFQQHAAVFCFGRSLKSGYEKLLWETKVPQNSQHSAGGSKPWPTSRSQPSEGFKVAFSHNYKWFKSLSVQGLI